jgi:aminobenzoyl-glutamate transport protein
MMPYSITFIISWTSLRIIWIVCDIPMGPGAPLFLAKAD